MTTSDTQVLPRPPSLTAALLAGFDAITANLGVLAVPILFDLFLWLGPRLSLKPLVDRLLQQMAALPNFGDAQLNAAMDASQQAWLAVGERFNLFTLLRAYPVGLPSLMASSHPAVMPAGSPQVIAVASPFQALLIWIGFTLLGLALGALFFSLVSQASLQGKIDLSECLRFWPWASFQVIYLALLWLLLFVAVSVPLTCGLTFLILMGMGLGSGMIFLYLIWLAVVLWLVMLLAFSPHGIFVYRQPAHISLVQGFRLVRLTLIPTGIMLLLVLVISQGLDLLWRLPAADSWFSVVGVIAHAFIAAGLLAATFIYYKQTTEWIILKAKILAQAGS